MAKELPMTAENYVVNRLLTVEAEIGKLASEINYLKVQKKALEDRFDGIKKHYKVVPASDRTKLKIVFLKDLKDKYFFGTTLTFSGSLDPEKFDEEFKLYIQLFNLSAEVSECLKELADEDGEGSTENK